MRRFDPTAGPTAKDWIVDTGARRPDGKILRLGMSAHLTEEQAIAHAKQTLSVCRLKSARMQIKRRGDRLWQSISLATYSQPSKYRII